MGQFIGFCDCLLVVIQIIGIQISFHWFYYVLCIYSGHTLKKNRSFFEVTTIFFIPGMSCLPWSMFIISQYKSNTIKIITLLEFNEIKTKHYILVYFVITSSLENKCGAYIFNYKASCDSISSLTLTTGSKKPLFHEDRI